MKTKVLPRTWKILSREAHLDPPALSPPLLAYSAPATLAFFLLFWKTLCSLHLKAMAFDGMFFSQRSTGSTLSTPSSTDLLLTVVQSLSRVRLRVTPWTAARQTSLSFTTKYWYLFINVTFSLKLLWAAYLKVQLFSPALATPKLFFLKHFPPPHSLYHYCYWLSAASH